MAIELNIILMIDNNSRRRIRVNPADLTYYKVHIISDFTDITDELVEKTNKVILLNDVLKSAGALSSMRLYKELFNLEYYFIGDEDIYLGLMSAYASCYKMNISGLNSDMLQAVIFNDTTLIEKFETALELPSRSLLAARDILNTTNIPAEIYNLAEEHIELLQATEDTLRLNKSLKDLYEQTDLRASKLEKEVKKCEDFCAGLINKFHKFTKDTKQYESLLSKDLYTKLHLSDYPDKPMILYFKEYEELDGLDVMLYWLYQIFSIQLRVPTKVVKLYDSYDAKRLRVQPSAFTVLGNKYTLTDIVANNYIETGKPEKSDLLVKSGDYTKLMDILLTNKERKGLLIVVDCKLKEDTILIGNTLQYALCRNASHAKAFDLGENTISNNGSNELVWNLDDLPEMEGRYMHEVLPEIAALPVMSRLYTDLQRYITN